MGRRLSCRQNGERQMRINMGDYSGRPGEAHQIDSTHANPGKDASLVEVRTVSLNYRDTEGKIALYVLLHNTYRRNQCLFDYSSALCLVAMGLYKHHKAIVNANVVPCSDMCGIVVEVGGNNANGWNVGDRILSIFNQTHLTSQIKEADMTYGLGLPLDGVLQTYRISQSLG